LQEADLGISPFTHTAARAEVVDFTGPVIQDGVGFLMKKTNEENKMFRLVKPFSTYVWISLAVSIVFVGMVAGLINRFTPLSGYRRKFSDATEDEISMRENLWLTFRSFLSQSELSYVYRLHRILWVSKDHKR
jgi:ABC-type amino acid transport substrate-binding protein